MVKKILALSCCSLMFCAFACSDDDDNPRSVIDEYCEHEMECNTQQYVSYDKCYERMRGTYDQAYDYRRCTSEIRDAFLNELKNMTDATCNELYDFYDGKLSSDYFYDRKAENRSTDCQIDNYGQKYF